LSSPKVSAARADIQFTIHKEYPFTAEGVSQSQIDISSRGTVGKLLIKVSD
jgi:NADPH2:quinone reductase